MIIKYKEIEENLIAVECHFSCYLRQLDTWSDWIIPNVSSISVIAQVILAFSCIPNTSGSALRGMDWKREKKEKKMKWDEMRWYEIR